MVGGGDGGSRDQLAAPNLYWPDLLPGRQEVMWDLVRFLDVEKESLLPGRQDVVYLPPLFFGNIKQGILKLYRRNVNRSRVGGYMIEAPSPYRSWASLYPKQMNNSPYIYKRLIELVLKLLGIYSRG